MDREARSSIDIVTSCDENYFFFLKNFSENVHSIYNKKPYVYNLGIKPESEKKISAHFINLDIDNEFKKINDANCIRATHKPQCILDFAKKTDNSFIFIDTDCLFIKQMKKIQKDILFTYRIYSEQTQKDFKKNGLLNSGVIFFKNDPARKKDLENFLVCWQEKCANDPDITDQKALSDLLLSMNPHLSPQSEINYRSLSLKIGRSEDYNDTKQSTGWIWHFKGAGRREDKKNKYIATTKKIAHHRYRFLASFYFQRVFFKIKEILQPLRYKYRYRKALEDMRIHE